MQHIALSLSIKSQAASHVMAKQCGRYIADQLAMTITTMLALRRDLVEILVNSADPQRVWYTVISVLEV